MNADVTHKLEALRADFAEVTGRPFVHFFCPVLFRDEEASLCKAHIVNSAFAASSRKWTIQRQDVDHFYGSMFEAEFVALQNQATGVAAAAFFDSRLYRTLKPKILLDGKEVEHFVLAGRVPATFVPVVFEREGRQVRVGLKLPPQEVLAKADAHWEVSVSKDVRLAAFVSVLKAAHLTMFEMLGYRYALSPGGLFLGQILGQFFQDSASCGKAEVLAMSPSYFQNVSMLVRPVREGFHGLTGSIDDRIVHVCWSGGEDLGLWGAIVFVRTHRMLHAALVPVFQNEHGAVRFVRFLESRDDAFDTSVARFERDHWLVAKERKRIVWPQASFADQV